MGGVPVAMRMNPLSGWWILKDAVAKLQYRFASLLAETREYAIPVNVDNYKPYITL